jgi:hypothetical protein
MSIPGIIVAGCVAVAGWMGSQKIQEEFPPIIKDIPKPGDKVGSKEFVWGHFGGGKGVIETGLDFKRETYTADIETAQRYGMMAEDPATAVLVGTRPPTYKDLGPQAFEGPYAPFTPEALEEANVRVYAVYPVNKDTKVGLFASIERAKEYWFPSSAPQVSSSKTNSNKLYRPNCANSNIAPPEKRLEPWLPKFN